MRKKKTLTAMKSMKNPKSKNAKKTMKNPAKNRNVMSATKTMKR